MCHSKYKSLPITALTFELSQAYSFFFFFFFNCSASTAKESLLYSYGKSFNGFAAKLNDEEVEKFSGECQASGKEWNFTTVCALKAVEMYCRNGRCDFRTSNHRLNLHTTRSWDFMGFPSKGKVGSHQEGDVIIGLLDTGYHIKHTIVTNSLWVNNKANAQIWSFSTSVVL